MSADISGDFGLRAIVPAGPHHLFAALIQATALASNVTSTLRRFRDHTKRTTAGGELAEDAAFDAELRFDDEVHHVVRDQIVITGSWIHLDRCEWRALDLNSVSPGACSVKRH